MMENSFKLQGKAKTIVTYTDRRPCFYKIISSESLSSNHMCIPPDFKKHIVKDMSNRVLLKVYGGGSHYVRLIRGAGNIFLKDGWPEFAQEHALGNNEFLLFTYEGKACFSVQIFDINGLERVISKSDPTTRKHQQPIAPKINQARSDHQPRQQRALKKSSDERLAKGKEKAIERELSSKEETEERLRKGKEKAIKRESPSEEETDLDQSQPRLLQHFLRRSRISKNV